MSEVIKNYSWDNKEIKLLNCPFCDGSPKLTHIGNNHTKKISIDIKCTKCRVKIRNSTLTKSFKWLEEVSIKYWNNRPKHCALYTDYKKSCQALKDYEAQKGILDMVKE